MLASFDQNRQTLLSFLANPSNKGSYEWSQVNLLQHRMKYIWSTLNLISLQNRDLFNGDDQLWVVSDHSHCFELFVILGNREAMEHVLSKKGKCKGVVLITKLLGDKFGDYFCKVKFDDSSDENVANETEFVKIIKDWITRISKPQKSDSMLKRALSKTEKPIARSQSSTLLRNFIS